MWARWYAIVEIVRSVHNLNLGHNNWLTIGVIWIRSSPLSPPYFVSLGPLPAPLPSPSLPLFPFSLRIWKSRPLLSLFLFDSQCIPRSPLRQNRTRTDGKKKCKPSWQRRRGRKKKRGLKGVGKRQTYASICTVFSSNPFPALT